MQWNLHCCVWYCHPRPTLAVPPRLCLLLPCHSAMKRLTSLLLLGELLPSGRREVCECWGFCLPKPHLALHPRCWLTCSATGLTGRVGCLSQSTPGTGCPTVETCPCPGQLGLAAGDFFLGLSSFHFLDLRHKWRFCKYWFIYIELNQIKLNEWLECLIFPTPFSLKISVSLWSI